MARISHYKNGFNVYMTQRERELLGDRIDFTLHPKSDGEFLRLHTNSQGRCLVMPQENKTLPWRLWLGCNAQLPDFAPEEVVMRVVAGGAVAVSKPAMQRPPIRKSYPALWRGSAVSADKTVPVPVRTASKRRQASNNKMANLRDAIYAINKLWEELGGDLEITVDSANHKVTARHMVEY